jgi:hypothetical protein
MFGKGWCIYYFLTLRSSDVSACWLQQQNTTQQMADTTEIHFLTVLNLEVQDQGAVSVVSGEACLPGSYANAPLSPHIDFPLYACGMWGESSTVSLPLLIRIQILSD